MFSLNPKNYLKCEARVPERSLGEPLGEARRSRRVVQPVALLLLHNMISNQLPMLEVGYFHFDHSNVFGVFIFLKIVVISVIIEVKLGNIIKQEITEL